MILAPQYALTRDALATKSPLAIQNMEAGSSLVNPAGTEQLLQPDRISTVMLSAPAGI